MGGNFYLIYDGDGNRAKSRITTNRGTTTTYFVGKYYQVTDPGTPQQTITKYYFAGTQRIAMRKYIIPQPTTVEYLISTSSIHRFSDHLSSTSLTTDSNGIKVSEIRYSAWGEVRYSWTVGQSTTPTYRLLGYTFTGQRDDTADFGLMFYNARWYDTYPKVSDYEAITAKDGHQGLSCARHKKPDSIVLDWMLLNMDKWDVCRTIRRESGVPNIMLIARVEETDKLIGLELGADGYMTKPFSPRELVVRVKN